MLSSLKWSMLNSASTTALLLLRKNNLLWLKLQLLLQVKMNSTFIIHLPLRFQTTCQGIYMLFIAFSYCIIVFPKWNSILPFCSQHIFQVDDVWIDKRTLALSMRSGCWFNHFAMFAFCKMFNHQQKERLKCRQQNREELTCFYMNKKITVRLLHFVHSF